MSIEPLPPAERDFLRAFDLTALMVGSDGGIHARRDPTGAAAAWWCEAREAGRVVRLARKLAGDVPSAAQALGVTVTEHAAVLTRAEAAVAKIEAGMAWAQRTGVLHELNREYRRRRIEAVKKGRRFMSYQQAQARLRASLGKIAAGGVTSGMIERVFEAD
jgi:hypothetical protein